MYVSPFCMTRWAIGRFGARCYKALQIQFFPHAYSFVFAVLCLWPLSTSVTASASHHRGIGCLSVAACSLIIGILLLWVLLLLLAAQLMAQHNLLPIRVRLSRIDSVPIFLYPPTILFHILLVLEFHLLRNFNIAQ